MINESLFLEFFSSKSLNQLQIEYKVDARTIKKYWIKKYGEESVKNRKSVHSDSIVNKSDLIDKIFSDIRDGKSLHELHIKFGIKKS